MKSCKARLAQQLMKNMPHFVEEHLHIKMGQKCGLLRSSFREAGDDRYDGITSSAVCLDIAGLEWRHVRKTILSI